jgi:hypothetical protein
MTKNPTITIGDPASGDQPMLIGQGKSGKLLVDFARPFVVADSLAAAYVDLSADKVRDAGADEWCESQTGDGLDAEG